MTRRFAFLMLGVAVALALWAVGRLADLEAPFPSWRPAVSPIDPSPTPTIVPAPRTLRTATQGAP
jgi:hypothetical protein